MAVDRNLANQCVLDLKAAADAITAAQKDLRTDHILTVYDQDVFLDASKDLQLPCVGIVYEGLTGVDQRGLGAELSCSFILITGSKERDIAGNEDRDDYTLILDRLRNEMLDRISPTGHKWQFDLEFPMDVVEGALSYYQRWKTKAVLT